MIARFHSQTNLEASRVVLPVYGVLVEVIRPSLPGATALI